MIFKVATMCSGIGSPEQALIELAIPHENVFACEKDKFATQTYLANFTPNNFYHDMTAEVWDLPEQYADLIVAGIPCQSFSIAGKRKGENDPRGLLIYDFITYIKNQNPKVFIIENVKGLLCDAGGVTFSKWCDLLGSSKNGTQAMFANAESCGYNLHYRVLNAKNYGLPQNRERVFIIGIRPDLPDTFRWPKEVVLKDRLIDLLESEVDEKYYLSDAMMAKLSECGTFVNKDTQSSQVNDIFGIAPTASAGTRGYSMGHIKQPRLNKFVETENSIRGVKSDGSGIQELYFNKPSGISNTISKSHKGKVVQLNQSKESGGNQPYQQNRIYDSDGISPAIDGKAGIYGICIRDSYLRRYTPLETMRLMGYHDSFVKPCSETQTYKQAGNSIPVHMMKAILKQLLPILTV